MAKTVEGGIKASTETFLKAEGLIPAGKAPLVSASNKGWYFKPVSGGMGVHGIPDYLLHYRGRFAGIETKVPGKDPTPLQQHQITAINTTGAVSFVVRCVEDLEAIRAWMRRVDREVYCIAKIKEKNLL